MPGLTPVDLGSMRAGCTPRPERTFVCLNGAPVDGYPGHIPGLAIWIELYLSLDRIWLSGRSRRNRI
jgi:hypothetical protein